MNLLSCASRAVEYIPWILLLNGWGPESDRDAHQTSWQDGTTGSALPMGRAIGWALCSSDNVGEAIEGYTASMCSG